MSLQLLKQLNGSNSGSFYEFITNYKKGNYPRIAWYPSASIDFHALLYLHPNYSKINPGTTQDPKSPDVFLYTDYKSQLNTPFLNEQIVFKDSWTTVTIDSIEELPTLDLPLHQGIVRFTDINENTNRALFLKIKIESNKIGDFLVPIIYIFAENEAFCGEILIPNNAKLSHIIHVLYGYGLGGGWSSGGWLLNVLKKFQCEIFISDPYIDLEHGDEIAIDLYPDLAKQNNIPAILEPIRVLNGKEWSNHGDVSWFIVR